jgi:hypothetical protein
MSLAREDKRSMIGRSAAIPIPLSTKISRSLPKIWRAGVRISSGAPVK